MIQGRIEPTPEQQLAELRKAFERYNLLADQLHGDPEMDPGEREAREQDARRIAHAYEKSIANAMARTFRKDRWYVAMPSFSYVGILLVFFFVGAAAASAALLVVFRPAIFQFGPSRPQSIASARPVPPDAQGRPGVELPPGAQARPELDAKADVNAKPATAPKIGNAAMPADASSGKAGVLAPAKARPAESQDPRLRTVKPAPAPQKSAPPDTAIKQAALPRANAAKPAETPVIAPRGSVPPKAPPDTAVKQAALPRANAVKAAETPVIAPRGSAPPKAPPDTGIKQAALPRPNVIQPLPAAPQAAAPQIATLQAAAPKAGPAQAAPASIIATFQIPATAPDPTPAPPPATIAPVAQPPATIATAAPLAAAIAPPVQAPSRPEPIIATHVSPPYPELSKGLGEQGTTMMLVAVSPQGAADDCNIVKSSSSLRLDMAACSYVQAHWKWKPATRNGQPIAASTNVTVVWNLKSGR